MTSTSERLSAALADRYRIERELGQGGMATVFLAEDLKHRRRVAVKVLRPELAAIIGADRFLKEIEVTANLQHPNILPLYDSGEADSFLYYVMPFVDGESLRDKLAREKQLAVEEAIGTARAVAAALDFAHKHGVVHRDIKPENILLQAGQALVADFGIALAVSQAGGSRMTETGMSLGTPHYMSPEQAAGDRTLDARSDVYALGCITYEMLAGEPPYLGNTAQAIVAKILTENPTPVRKRRPTVPAHVEAAIQTALAKLPADRFASAAEFAAALGNPGFTLAGTAGFAASATQGSRWKRIAMAGFGIAAVLAALLAWRLLAPARGSEEGAVTRVTVALAPGEEIRQGPFSRFAISPDGRRLAYVASLPGGGSQLMVRDLDQLHARLIPGTERALSPFFSPDGNSVAFFSGAAAPIALKVVSLSGAPPLVVADTFSSAFGGSWGEDGYLYVSARDGIIRIPAAGGALEQLTHVDRARGEFAHSWARLLPGAKALLFTVVRGNAADVAALDLASRRIVPVIPNARAPHYVPTGHLLYFSGERTMLAAPFDPVRLKLTGPAASILEGITIRNAGAVDADFSRTGTMVYTAGSGGVEYLNWVTREGAHTPVDTTWTADFITHALSPDGRRAMVSVVREGGNRDLWAKELDRGPLTRFTFEGNTNQRPEWTADGKSVTFISDRSGKNALYQQRADGNGAPALVLTTKQEPRAIAEGFWSRDGKWLIYRTEPGEAGAGDIMGFRPGADSSPVPLVATQFREATPALSPDGRWLAYVSSESGLSEVYVRPFPNVGDGRWQVSVGTGREPVWAHNGRELFYKGADDMLTVATISTQSGFTVTDRKALFSASDYDNDEEHPRYNVSPDDNRFLMSRRNTGSGSELVLVLNWFTELRSRFGAKR